MKQHKIPLGYRDRCARLLVPLNECRRQTAFLPWKCSQLRHDYEECQYLDFQRRVKELQDQKEAAKANA
jgi:NADH dehydrogenase (ubiquinone) 1 beta subcomplex subunit 7